MNEEIEYAEMLEIPVSTVNVIQKRRRQKAEKENGAFPDVSTQSVPVFNAAYQANLPQSGFTGAGAFSAAAMPNTPLEAPPLGANPAHDPLRDSAIAQVNNRLQDNPEQEDVITAEAALFAESANSEGTLDFEIPDRIDTVRVYANPKPKRSFFKRRKKSADEEYAFEDLFTKNTQENLEFSNDDALDFERDFSADFPADFPTDFPVEAEGETQKEGGRYALNIDEEPRSFRIAMTAEFAATCALCGIIFLTNVFMPSSAINTFFRALNGNNGQTIDRRAYTDFTLSPVVSELSNAEFLLSENGVLSFTDECCVYPVANGTVSELQRLDNGTYRVKISHSDTFTGVIDGLDYVYYAVGEEVKSNVPVGFSKGETEVQMTMYSGGMLLNCFTITEENCLAWLDDKE